MVRIRNLTQGALVVTLGLAAGSAFACDGTGRDGCGCLAYSTDYHRIGDEVLVDYEMRVDPQDLRNSKGDPLGTIRAVLQQDRANYHRFGAASAADDFDPYFGTAENRQRFQTLPLTTFCETDFDNPGALRDPIDDVARQAMRPGTMLHVMLYRIGNALRLHIAPIG